MSASQVRLFFDLLWHSIVSRNFYCFDILSEEYPFERLFPEKFTVSTYSVKTHITDIISKNTDNTGKEDQYNREYPVLMGYLGLASHKSTYIRGKYW
jgi:hypothetical protein